jgi:actin related protein 2/3 complex, subunit 3
LIKIKFFILIKAEELDIIDEALAYFKANIFFKNFEIKSDADRTLIYITLYISECLRVLLKVKSIF